MIPRSSLKKLFFYLTGLVVACFFHLNCQVSTDATLGAGDTDVAAASSTPDDNKPSVATSIRFHTAMGGFVGEKDGTTQKASIIDDLVKDETININGINAKICRRGDDIIAYKIDNNGKLWLIVLDGSSKCPFFSGNYGEHIATQFLLSNANTLKEKLNDAYNSKMDKKALDEEVNKKHKNGIIALHKKGDRPRVTVCALTIDLSGNIESECLGDSRAMVFRNNNETLPFKTKKQRGLCFNNPNTLVYMHNLNPNVSEKENEQDDIFSNLQMTPKDCLSKKGKAQKRDVLIGATDGFFDNVDKKQIAQIINEIMSQNPIQPAQEILNKLIKTAKTANNSNDQRPYGRDLKKRFLSYDEYAEDYVYKALKDKDKDKYNELKEIRKNINDPNFPEEERKKESDKLDKWEMFTKGKPDDDTSIFVAIIEEADTSLSQ